MTDPVPDPAPRRMSDARYRALVVGALAVAGLALLLAVRATQTGGDDEVAVRGGEVVEHLFPRNGDQVLRQTEIGIDLAPGHEATLVVNGLPIPEDEQRLVPEQNQVFYTPRDGTTIEELPPGRTCVTAIVWRSRDGRGVDDRTISWCFEAT